MATAALSCDGQAIAEFFGTVVVVVDVGIVVVVVGNVVVTGTVVATVVDGIVDVVLDVVVVVVVVDVVVVVVGVEVEHVLGTVVVVEESAGWSWADVVDAVARMSDALRATVISEPLRSQ
jgi:hypothetical protein